MIALAFAYICCFYLFCGFNFRWFGPNRNYLFFPFIFIDQTLSIVFLFLISDFGFVLSVFGVILMNVRYTCKMIYMLDVAVISNCL